MTDTEKALLGDREAAKRLTEAGVLVPCPGCGGDNPVERYVCGDHFVICKTCGWMSPEKNTLEAARLAWNTRAPILNAEEMEMLHGKENT